MRTTFQKKIDDQYEKKFKEALEEARKYVGEENYPLWLSKLNQCFGYYTQIVKIDD